jgi:VIT1/CCC1 family predicted Fe2+/Mn2+ transporter
MAAFLMNHLFNRPSSPRFSAIPQTPTSLPRHSSFSSQTSDVEKLTPSSPDRSSSTSNGPSRIDKARLLSDAIIGLSDGLTVPFALTAGLSALGSTSVVIYGGLAELIAGSISMGLGGYLGAKSEADSYYATRKQTEKRCMTDPMETEKEVEGLFEGLGVPEHLAREVARCISQDQGSEGRAVDFLMSFQHSMTEPPSNRAFICALTIALGYLIGGFVPLVPYFFVAKDAVRLGLLWSACVMVITLFLFGYGKTSVVHGWSGRKEVWRAVKGGVEMVVVGSVAAGAAMALVAGFNRGVMD